MTLSLAISIALFAALAILAVVHAWWASGRVWPARDPQELSAYVIGDPRRPGMPPAHLIWLVALALAVAALDGLALGFEFGGMIDKAVAWVGAGLCAVFACRGVAGYTPVWRAAHSGVAFALLDKRFYSPFCILVAEGFFSLVSERL